MAGFIDEEETMFIAEELHYGYDGQYDEEWSMMVSVGSKNFTPLRWYSGSGEDLPLEKVIIKDGVMDGLSGMITFNEKRLCKIIGDGDSGITIDCREVYRSGW